MHGRTNRHTVTNLAESTLNSKSPDPFSGEGLFAPGWAGPKGVTTLKTLKWGGPQPRLAVLASFWLLLLQAPADRRSDRTMTGCRQHHVAGAARRARSWWISPPVALQTWHRSLSHGGVPPRALFFVRISGLSSSSLPLRHLVLLRMYRAGPSKKGSPSRRQRLAPAQRTGHCDESSPSTGKDGKN